VRESGFGREGGWEGLLAYSKPKGKAAPLKAPAPFTTQDGTPADPLDRTAKLYIGGKQARPNGGYSQPVFNKSGKLLGHASVANRKDLRNAVEANLAAKGWSKTTGHLRAQILYYIGENLSARADEFAARVNALTGGRTGAAETQEAIDHLFTWAAWADKHDGAAKGVPMRGVALAMNEPVGNIGVLTDDTRPLMGLIEPLAPALAMGNRITAVASEAFPLAATDFYQVLDTSDVPGGVVNILTGSHNELAPHMGGHMGLDAMWSFSSANVSKVIEEASAETLKRTWVNNGLYRCWPSEIWRAQATEIKTVWIPYGE